MKTSHPALFLRKPPKWYRPIETTMRCQGQCGRTCRVRRYGAMTQYVNPALNRSNYFCEDCIRDYAEYWQERWAEYYADCM